MERDPHEFHASTYGFGDIPAAAAISTHRSHIAGEIGEEECWRDNPEVRSNPFSPLCVVGIWNDRSYESRIYISPILEQHYTIEILLSDALVDCTRNGVALCTRAGQFGAVQITPPGEQIRCRFERPIKSIHFFIPTSTMSEALAQCRPHAGNSGLRDPCYRRDPILGRFASALLDVACHGPRQPLFAQIACQAVIAYLARAEDHQESAVIKSAGLQRWRLHKVMDFVRTNASQPITLQAMADQAGLSRMHFAAQFQLACGVSPHAFLTETRLAVAKRLMTVEAMPLAEVAIRSGFNSQSHFTSVFRKATGLTPGRWRTSVMEAKFSQSTQ